MLLHPAVSRRGRRLLYVNLDFPPMSGPGIWRALGFAKYLPENGYDVTVLCSDRSPSRARYDDSLLAHIPPSTIVHRIPSRFQKDIADDIGRLRDAPLPDLLRRGLLRAGRRFLHEYPDPQFHWAMKVAAKGAQLLYRGEADALVTSGPPHVAHLAGLLMQRAKRVPWIVDYRDLWTDDAVQVKQTSYQQRAFERVERRVVRSAQSVVVVSPGYRARLEERFADVLDDDIVVIRNGHDIPAELLELADEKPKNERLRIHFNGTPQYTHPFGLVVDTVARLVERVGPQRAPLVTFTGFPADLAEEIEKRGLEDHVKDVGHMSRDESIRLCLGCDVLLAMVNDTNPLYRGTIPGKAYEALALGRYLLAILPAGSVVGEMIEEAEHGALCDVGDPDDVYRAFATALERFERGTIHDQSPQRRRALAEQYSRRRQAAELAVVLDRSLP